MDDLSLDRHPLLGDIREPEGWADILRASGDTIAKKCRANQIRHYKTEGKILVSDEHIFEYLKHCEVAPEWADTGNECGTMTTNGSSFVESAESDPSSTSAGSGNVIACPSATASNTTISNAGGKTSSGGAKRKSGTSKGPETW